MSKNLKMDDFIHLKYEIFNNYKKWLLNPRQSFNELCGNTYCPLNYFMSISKRINKLPLITPTPPSSPTSSCEITPNMLSTNQFTYTYNYNKQDKINLIIQFYIDKDPNRQKEILKTLFLNVNNNYIDNIYLFNERIYTEEELGVKSDKIIQININTRLSFKNIFNLIDEYKIEGFIVIANSDIFFDRSLERIKECDLLSKNILSLCRYEYKPHLKLKDCKLFDNGRPDSQDVWIFHSINNIKQNHRNIFDFHMGKSGCDNKLIYLFQILGYQCYNEPCLIRCYHNHNVPVRNYDVKEKVSGPYCAIYPVLNNIDKPHPMENFNILLENDNLSNYITNKINNNQPFIIPRIAGIENNVAHYGIMIKQHVGQYNQTAIENILKVMKNNAGIHITNLNSLINYSIKYLEAFNQCDLFFDWEPWGNVARHIIDSINFIHNNFKKNRTWAFTLDVFNYIQGTPWTLALKNKRLLIISSFSESINEKISIREKIYGMDLFPGCEIICLKPPQTQGNNVSQEFNIELDEFINKVKSIENKFDIALVSCGGYGNLVCSEIYKMNKSAIYVGGVLQMYFGIYGSRWERERPEIMTLYKNEYWSRPKEEERPSGYQNVESSCYW